MQQVLHSCKKEIQQAKLRVTPARVAMMQLFESHEKPLDAQHLIDHLDKNLGIDRVTVFRMLNSFVASGLLNKIEFKEGKSRYELASRGDHHHFVCSSCGEISNIGKDTLMHDYIEKLEKIYGFQVKEHALEFFGVCKKCQKL